MNGTNRTISTSTWGMLFWTSIAVGCLIVLSPLFYVGVNSKVLRFGIDLVGGTYITLEVKTDKAVEHELISRMQTIETRLKEAKLPQPVSKKVENNALVISFETPDAKQKAADLIRANLTNMTLSEEGSSLQLKLSEAEAERIKLNAVNGNMEVFERRLQKTGAEEISITRKGSNRIIVELPHVSNPQEAKAMIGKSAILEFKIVEKMGSKDEDILFEYDGELPEDMEIVPGKEGERYLLPKYTQITGSLLTDAHSGIETGASRARRVVNFEFNAEGAEKFARLTRDNVGRQLAAVLDGVVITAPRIKTEIGGGKGYIEGDFSGEQAKELSLLLKTGSLSAPVTFEEERQIGPSLGAESIRQGLMSCLVGLLLLLIFSVYYYRLCGLLAFLALMFNLLLTLIFLKAIGATLTLPGIAGMVLTIGMAIDASILIFEQIKESLARGESVKDAIRIGFSDAMVVILDANITTFIVGVVLYMFGTGPIRGFAVTMMLGIVSTLITGLFFLKTTMNFFVEIFAVKRLKI